MPARTSLLCFPQLSFSQMMFGEWWMVNGQSIATIFLNFHLLWLFSVSVAILRKATCFLHIVILDKAIDFQLWTIQATQPKAPHHIIGGEHLRQTVEAVDGLLLALHVGQCRWLAPTGRRSSQWGEDVGGSNFLLPEGSQNQQGEGHLSEAKTLVAPTSFCLRALRNWGALLLLPATGRCDRFASRYLVLAYCMQRYKIIIPKKYFYVFLHLI